MDVVRHESAGLATILAEEARPPWTRPALLAIGVYALLAGVALAGTGPGEVSDTDYHPPCSTAGDSIWDAADGKAGSATIVESSVSKQPNAPFGAGNSVSPPECRPLQLGPGTWHVVTKTTRASWVWRKQFGTLKETDFKTSSTTTRKSVTIQGGPPRKKPPPAADPGGPYQDIERGHDVTLDGSRSKGDDFEWTFRALDCPGGLLANQAARKEGMVVTVTLLCSVEATLKVTDEEGRSSSKSVRTTVLPRKGWTTEFRHDPVLGRMEGWKPIQSPEGKPFDAGSNRCAEEIHVTDVPTADQLDKKSLHVFHPALKDEKWDEVNGQSVFKRVEDESGPFHGWHYVLTRPFSIARRAWINQYVLEAGPVPLERLNNLPGAENLYQAASRAGCAVAEYVAAVKAHENEHSRLMKRSLAANDPMKDIEAMIDPKDRKQLKQRVEARARAAEDQIVKDSDDPLACSWRGYLPGLMIDTDQWAVSSAPWQVGFDKKGACPPIRTCTRARPGQTLQRPGPR